MSLVEYLIKMYEEELEKFVYLNFDDNIEEALSPAKLAQLKKLVQEPEVRPTTADRTVEGWLKRLELFWGKPQFILTDPELGIKNRKITRKEFLDRIQNTELLRMVGKWHIEKLDVNKVMFYRDYIGHGGKKYREKIIVDVKLKPELRKFGLLF